MPESENDTKTLKHLENLDKVYKFILKKKGQVVDDDFIEYTQIHLQLVSQEIALMHQRNKHWQTTCEVLQMKKDICQNILN